MFFRETSSKQSKKSTLQLVKNNRVGDKIRQRIVVSLGTNFFIPRALRKQVAAAIDLQLQGQETLFLEPDVRDYADRIVKRIQTEGRWNSGLMETTTPTGAVAEAYIDQVEHGQGRILGPVLIGDCFWQRLGFPDILGQCGFNARQTRLAEISILNRLIAGDSEHSIPSWIKTATVADVIDKNAEEYARDRFYRISDKLLEQQKTIEQQLYAREKTLFQLESTIYLYDLTNTYFEGKASRISKAEYNKNQKEKRSDCPQIVVALVLDGDGFIRKHFRFRGKMSDSKSLEKILNALASEFSASAHPTVIVDRGVTTDDNIKLLKSRGIHYVVACRNSEEADFISDFETADFTVLKSEPGNTVEIYLTRKENETFLLCKSEGRAAKEKAIRNQREQKLETDLLALKTSIENGRQNQPTTIEQKIGRLRERYASVAQYYEIEFSPFSFTCQIGENVTKRVQNSLNKLKEKANAYEVSYLKVQKKMAELTTKYPAVMTQVSVLSPDL